MELNEKIFIIGAGGHTRTTIAILSEKYLCNQIICVDCPKFPDEKILNVNIVQYDIDFLKKANNVFISIGDDLKRKEIFDFFNKEKVINVISKTALIHKTCKMGKGNLISFKTIICPNVVIGDNNIINTGSIVEHECRIGSSCHIAPGSILLGRVTIGDLVLIGAGSVIKGGITIGNRIKIGAGSVVLNDLSEPGTYIGIPAKRAK